MKKSSKGTIMRLIDVVMILLLGFMQSSTVIHRSELELPSKTGRKAPKDKKQEILPIEVRVLPGDTTMADIDPKTEFSLINLGQLFCYYRVIEQNKSYHIRMLDILKEHLLRTRASYDSVIVIIKPDSQSIIQGTINLIDVCRDNGFKRKFQYTEE